MAPVHGVPVSEPEVTGRSSTAAVLHIVQAPMLSQAMRMDGNLGTQAATTRKPAWMLGFSVPNSSGNRALQVGEEGTHCLYDLDGFTPAFGSSDAAKEPTHCAPLIEAAVSQHTSTAAVLNWPPESGRHEVC